MRDLWQETSHLQKALPHPQTFYGDLLTSAEQTFPILPEGPRSGPLLGPCVHIIKPQISSWHLGTIIAPQKHEASIRLPAVWQLIPIGHVWSEDRSCSRPDWSGQRHADPCSYKQTAALRRITWLKFGRVSHLNMIKISMWTNNKIMMFYYLFMCYTKIYSLRHEEGLFWGVEMAS